jgi:hypothetical protein
LSRYNEARQAGLAVAVHPITQRLAIHPALARCIHTAGAVFDHGQCQHTPRGGGIVATGRFPTKLRC